MNKKKGFIGLFVLLLIIVIIAAITVTLVLVLRKSKKDENKSRSLDDVISDNSTFPDGTYQISADSLKSGSSEQAPLFVNISILNELGLRVDNSSLIAETNRLSYFFVRLPGVNTTNNRIKREVTASTESIGIRFGNSNTINVIPLNLSSIDNSGVSLLGRLTDDSQVYQVEVRMADALCSNNNIGSCSIVNWTSYSISSDEVGSRSNFDNQLPVACGSQCDAASSSPCATSCSTCDGQQVAGADTPVTRRYKMNTTSANNISFSYETYTVKDRITVSYAGQTLFDSGCVGTNGEKIAPISFKGNSEEVRVDVEPNCLGTTGTAWYFTLPCVDCQGCKEYQCLDDSKAHCGPKGYLINYGLYYCNRYYDNYDSFNAGGQALIECVRPRLLNYLKNYLDGTQNVDCDDLYNAAFDSHVQIYLDCNFCDVVLNNKWGFFKVLYTNLFNGDAWKQFFQILLSCGPNYKPQFCDDIPQAC